MFLNFFVKQNVLRCVIICREKLHELAGTVFLCGINRMEA